MGVLVTPWFMNIVLLPNATDDWTQLRTGEREFIDFPSGTYEFLAANRPETGPYKACSLFSPMFDFSSMLQAVETAEAVMPGLLDAANREDGTRSGEIRRRAEAEEAARAAAEAAALAPEAETAPRREAPAELSRRSLLLGPRAGADDIRDGAA